MSLVVTFETYENILTDSSIHDRGLIVNFKMFFKFIVIATQMMFCKAANFKHCQEDHLVKKLLNFLFLPGTCGHSSLHPRAILTTFDRSYDFEIKH